MFLQYLDMNLLRVADSAVLFFIWLIQLLQKHSE